MGNLIYRGEGVITTGSVTYPARFSVAIEDGEIVAKLTSAAAGVEVHGGFKDEASRSDFIQRVRESVMAVHS